MGGGIHTDDRQTVWWISARLFRLRGVVNGELLFSHECWFGVYLCGCLCDCERDAHHQSLIIKTRHTSTQSL